MHIGPYKATHYLGAGGMGVVFRVEDRSGKPFALKMIGTRAAVQATLHIDRALNNKAALDLGRRMMLVREASLAMRLKHPNIVQTFHYGQHQGLLYLVLELLEGRSLDKVLPFHSVVPLPTRLRIIRQLCDALEYAHRDGVLHRDIKPANTFVLSDSSVKVLDFGLATLICDANNRPELTGTPSYMAPESLIAGPFTQDRRADIWATGVTLYQLLTGRLPFSGRTLDELFSNIRQTPHPPLPPDFPHVRELNCILGRALAKNPAQRYAAAAELARDLAALEQNAFSPQPGSTRPSTASDDAPWWATTVAQIRVPVAVPLDKPHGTISLVAAAATPEPRHVRRFLKYTAVLEAILPKALMFAGYPALLLVFAQFCAAPFVRAIDALRFQLSFHRTLSSGGTLLAGAPFYCVGLAIPVALAVAFGLGLLAFREKLLQIPRCRTCDLCMKHLSRIDRFSYTESSHAHASSDCLAALTENLWEDAATLLSLHGELFLPKVRTKLPIIRYYLDFYMCRECGDESALLTAEDQFGWPLNIKGTAGVYKSKNPGAVAPSHIHRWPHLKQAIKTAIERTTETIESGAVKFAATASLLIFLYYYPFLPHLLHLAEHKGEVTIWTDPPGQSVLVDGKSVTAPKRFVWPYNSSHIIAGLTNRTINGNTYLYREIHAHAYVSTWPSQDRHSCRGSNFPPPRGCSIRVFNAAEVDRVSSQAYFPSYTVIFEKEPSKPEQSGTTSRPGP